MKTIHSIVEMLSHEGTNVVDIIRAVGREVEKQAGSGYRLRPHDANLASAWVGLDGDNEEDEVPQYVELTFESGAEMRLDDLQGMFGMWKNVPASPDGEPHVVKFRYDKAGETYLILLYATLSGEAGDSRSVVKELVIQREERL